MGDRGADRLVRLQQRLDAIEHQVEGAGEMIEFVVGAGFGNTPPPVAGDNRLRRARASPRSA